MFLISTPARLSGEAGSSAANAGRQAPAGSEGSGWNPSSHACLLPGWRAGAGQSRPGMPAGDTNTGHGTPRPCPLTDSRLCCLSGHVSGLHAFTPQARGTLGTRGPPCVRARAAPAFGSPAGLEVWMLRVSGGGGSGSLIPAGGPERMERHYL